MNKKLHESEQRGGPAIIAVFALVGILQLLLVGLTGYGIPCVFRLVTGLLCPGCGMTHACLDLLRLDFAGAWHDNPLSLTALPVLLAWLVVQWGRKRWNLPEPGRWIRILEQGILILLLILCIGFGIWRNVRTWL